MCIRDRFGRSPMFSAKPDFSIIQNSRTVDFVEDRLRERGSLPATFDLYM